MYSAELQAGRVRAALPLAGGALRAPLAALLRELLALREDAPADGALDALPDALLQALQAANAVLGDHFQRHPTAVGALLDFHFELLRFARLADTLGEHTLVDVQAVDAPADASNGQGDEGRAPADRDLFGAVASPAGQGPDTVLSLRNIVPARFLRPRIEAWHSVTLISATLGPPAYLGDLLGLPPDAAHVDVPPAFPAEHLTVQVARHVSTRYVHRARSLDALVGVIAGQVDAHPGNYLAFFSSFDYLQQAALRLAERRPDVAQWCQARAMTAGARDDFLARFEPRGRGVGFAVLGGVFAEGVDLPGSRLIGAFVATLGLPPVSPLQDRMRERLDKLFGPDHGYADRVPAMQKVVQAAGRVLRTPEDRGWLWLLDDRYGSPEFAALLPPWWGLAHRETPASPIGSNGRAGLEH